MKCHYKKIATFALAALLSNSVFSATDWEQLLKVTKSAEFESIVVDPDGFVEVRVAHLPNERVRFMGFKKYSNPLKMKLLVSTPTYDMRIPNFDMKNICNDYVIFKKSFKAVLTFSMSPVEENFQIRLRDGRKISAYEFENPISSSDALVIPLSNSYTFPWTVNSMDLFKFEGKRLQEAIPDLINDEIKKRKSSTVTVDLSDYNGVACDLGLGSIAPVLEKTFTYEKGLPNSSFWINQSKYVEIYNSFWREYSRAIKNVNQEDMKVSELLLLGINLADKDEAVQSLFEKNGRVMTLYNSFKYKKDKAYDDYEVQWRQTFDYEVAKDTMATQTMVLQSGKVYTRITK